MIAPHPAAQLCAAIYDGSSPWDHHWSIGGIVCGHKHIAGDDVFAFRGSASTLDWIKDAGALPVSDHEVGIVHAGFLVGMDDFLLAALPVMQASKSIVLTGHSLGGAHARIGGAKLVCRKLAITQIITFGSPKPGYSRLSDILQRSAVNHSSFRNQLDPVPTLPMFGAWQHPEQYTPVSASPSFAMLPELADHEIALYVKATA